MLLSVKSAVGENLRRALFVFVECLGQRQLARQPLEKFTDSSGRQLAFASSKRQLTPTADDVALIKRICEGVGKLHAKGAADRSRFNGPENPGWLGGHASSLNDGRLRHHGNGFERGCA